MNYKHLHYFYTVAEYGSIQAAANTLCITPQTISGQLRQLEDQLQVQLLEKSGRGLQLTAAGQQAYEYCQDIFRLGDELQETLHLNSAVKTNTLRVGVIDALPKTIIQGLLTPAIKETECERLSIRELTIENLMAELITHKLDLVLADSPAPVAMASRCVSQLLSTSTLSCFAAPSLWQPTTGKTFPDCLDGAPILLPTESTSALKTALLAWLGSHTDRIHIAGEFDDSALMKAFGSNGHGFFFSPSHITQDICQRYQVHCVGQISEIQQHIYAITTSRKQQHPSVVQLLKQPSALTESD